MVELGITSKSVRFSNATSRWDTSWLVVSNNHQQGATMNVTTNRINGHQLNGKAKKPKPSRRQKRRLPR